MISGLITLRAYDSFDHYKKNFLEILETGANSTFCYSVMNRWIGLRLDMICTIIAIMTSVFCVIFKGQMETNLLVFSLQITLDISVLFSLSIRFGSEMHNQMLSSKKIY